MMQRRKSGRAARHRGSAEEKRETERKKHRQQKERPATATLDLLPLLLPLLVPLLLQGVQQPLLHKRSALLRARDPSLQIAHSNIQLVLA